MNPTFQPKEKLYRAIRPIPRLWDWEKNRPSPAAFIDANGLSVDRDGGRTDNAIVSSFTSKFGQLQGVVNVSAAECTEIQAVVVPKPTSNQYHAEIHGSIDEKRLSKIQALRLSQICTIV